MASQVRITEIFYSLQGESSRVGLPTVFIRLTGCPLRCVYCDTAYAFEGGRRVEIAEILDQTKSFKTPYVTVTGGEPLAQPESLVLLKELADQGFDVSLETSGAMSIESVDPRISTIMDLKTPSSGECHRNLYENITHLKKTDEVKFVIETEDDYQWCKSKLMEYRLADRVAAVLFSPVFGKMDATVLAEKLLEDRLPVRFQTQLHKSLWSEEQGR
jgi:7-carboxy-7-deazaguanine synthase